MSDHVDLVSRVRARAAAADAAAEGQKLGEWPSGLLPFCQLDDTLIACIDCTDPSGPVIGFEVDEIDFDEATGFDAAFNARAPSLDVWLSDWLAGR